MKKLTVPIFAVLIITLTLIGCSLKSVSEPSASGHKPLVVFLVRHCEKAHTGKDPELTAAGRERAAVLAATLRSANIEYIHSSDFIRTRRTVEPLAAEFGLEVELYDHQDLPALAKKLRKTGGRHLVVGHKITTPPLVELLGGNPGPAINMKSEYDRLYIVTIGNDGASSCVMMRYGKAYHPE